MIEYVEKIEEELNIISNALTRTRALLDNLERQIERQEQPKRSLYWLASNSGRRDGHFIEVFEKNRVSCSCPGFINRSYCWASSWVQKNYSARRMVKYPYSDRSFDERAYPLNQVGFRVDPK